MPGRSINEGARDDAVMFAKSVGKVVVESIEEFMDSIKRKFGSL